jgi:lipid-A-disaccharide synthase
MTESPQDQHPPPAPGPTSGPRVLISAAEPSADLHGASLIGEVRRRLPGVEFVGVGGPLMAQAGCRLLADLTTESSMLLGALSLVGRAWKLLRRLDRLLAEEPFDLGVVIDSPTLHLPLAKRLKRRQVPVLYYIAPQTWAWAEYRTRKLAKRVDRAAVILPFEQEYFRTKGIRADYVGHPLFDVLAERTVDRGCVARLREAGGPVVALLPGSRRQVIREVLPGQLEVSRRILRRFPEARFLLSAASETAEREIGALLAGAGPAVEVHQGHNPEIISAAELVLVASGTAALEVAYYRKPMIVMYNHSRWGYELIGKHLINTKYLSLPNILAGREVVPEFMPYYRRPDPIAAKAIEMLSTPQTLERIATELDELISPLATTGASANTADIVVDMLGA